jgi:hypothetical protein
MHATVGAQPRTSPWHQAFYAMVGHHRAKSNAPAASRRAMQLSLLPPFRKGQGGLQHGSILALWRSLMVALLHHYVAMPHDYGGDETRQEPIASLAREQT